MTFLTNIIDRIKSTQITDFLDRVIKTFLQAFVAAFLIGVGTNLNMPTVKAAAVAGIAAGLSAVTTLLKNDTPPIGFNGETWTFLDVVRTRADDIPVSPRSDFWVPRFTPRKDLYLDWGAFGQPQYTVDPKTAVKRRVFPRSGYDASGHLNPIPDIATLPHNFAPSTGSDNQADVFIPGVGWDSVWGYMDYWTSPITRILFWTSHAEWGRQMVYNSPRGMKNWDAVAGGLSHVSINQTGNAGFYCPGYPPFSVVPTADEVEAKLIGHAIGLTMSFTMGGPPAPRTILDVNHPDIGVKYKVACAPSMVIEYNPQATDITKGVMMSQRFRLSWSDAQLETWVATKPPANQTAARTFGRCLIDYGIVPNQSGPHDAVPLDSTQAKRYIAAGVTPNLLDGIDWAALVALDPPTAHYADGTTGTREGVMTSFGY